MSAVCVYRGGSASASCAVFGALEAVGGDGGLQVERRKSTDPKSRQGRPKVAHGFNRGLRVENGQSPGGAKEKMGLNRCVLSSLTGLVFYSRHNPAMNRWAIFDRPCGTWNHDTLNGYQGFTLGWNSGRALPLRSATIATLDAESSQVLGDIKELL